MVLYRTIISIANFYKLYLIIANYFSIKIHVLNKLWKVIVTEDWTDILHPSLCGAGDGSWESSWRYWRVSINRTLPIWSTTQLVDRQIPEQTSPHEREHPCQVTYCSEPLGVTYDRDVDYPNPLCWQIVNNQYKVDIEFSNVGKELGVISKTMNQIYQTV